MIFACSGHVNDFKIDIFSTDTKCTKYASPSTTNKTLLCVGYTLKS